MLARLPVAKHRSSGIAGKIRLRRRDAATGWSAGQVFSLVRIWIASRYSSRITCNRRYSGREEYWNFAIDLIALWRCRRSRAKRAMAVMLTSEHEGKD